MTGQLPETAAAESTTSDYNTLFEQLVDESPDDERVAGALAYVFYKIAKREWMQEFVAREGRTPNDVEVRAYIGTWTESRIGGVRSEARATLASFAEYIIDRERPGIVQEALQHRSFLREAGVAFVGAFFYTIALLVFAVVLKFAHIDLLSILQQIH